MESRYDVLIFDCYNVFMRWCKTQNEFLVKMDDKMIHLEGVIGFINAIETYIRKFAKDDSTKVYFLFDNAQTTWERKQKYDAYKSDRKPLTDSEYRQLDFCELICKYFRDNSFLFRVKFLEADDFVKNILNYYVKDDEKVLMISEDLDWCRSLSKNVHQYKEHKIWNVDYFEEVKGYYPTESNIIFDKTFYGDDSDSIVGGLPTLPKVYFKEIISNYTDIDDFLSDIHSDKLNYLDLGWITKIENEKEHLRMNWDLIKSAEISDVELDSYKFKCYFKENKLKIIYSSLSILGKVDNDRVKMNEVSSSIYDMLDGENLDRKH